MATVIRELFGHHPKFLRAPANRNLFDYLSILPDRESIRVVRKEWFQQGNTDSYWTLVRSKSTKEENGSPLLMGHLTWKGKMDKKIRRIPDADVKAWHIYQDPSDFISIASKLKITPRR
ncbi:hypothetical protein HDU67_000699 [Dinochytrium kinnereticum]|nr:hypothetical protein HDU67_000699 [Dinochytrium kinnereticum]